MAGLAPAACARAELLEAIYEAVARGEPDEGLRRVYGLPSAAGADVELQRLPVPLRRVAPEPHPSPVLMAS